MRIVLLGAPGSGKGTLGERLSAATGFPRISTGDALRRAVREGTPLGRRVEAVMKAGGLVSDDLVTGIVRDRLARPDCARGYILDGYPRTEAQALAREEMDGERPEIALDLEVSEEEIVRRLGLRRVCPACGAVTSLALRPDGGGACEACGAGLAARPDDEAAVVRERIRVYERCTAPLRGHYLARSTYRRVDGQGTTDEVFARAWAVVEAARARAPEAIR